AVEQVVFFQGLPRLHRAPGQLPSLVEDGAGQEHPALPVQGDAVGCRAEADLAGREPPRAALPCLAPDQAVRRFLCHGVPPLPGSFALGERGSLLGRRFLPAVLGQDGPSRAAACGGSGVLLFWTQGPTSGRSVKSRPRSSPPPPPPSQGGRSRPTWAGWRARPLWEPMSSGASWPACGTSSADGALPTSGSWNGPAASPSRRWRRSAGSWAAMRWWASILTTKWWAPRAACGWSPPRGPRCGFASGLAASSGGLGTGDLPPRDCDRGSGVLLSIFPCRSIPLN